MTFLTVLIGMAFAQDSDDVSYRYKIFSETIKDRRWTVQASNGFYDCRATIRCAGLGASMTIRSHKPTWHDPLLIYYIVDHGDRWDVKSCELRSCERVPELTYEDLKRFW